VRVRSVQVHDRRSRGRRPDSAWPSAFRESSDATSRAGTRSLRRAPTPSRTGSTSRSRSSRRSPTARGCRCISARAHGRRVVLLGGGYVQLRLREPVVAARGDRVILRAGRRSAGEWCSTLRLRATATGTASSASREGRRGDDLVPGARRRPAARARRRAGGRRSCRAVGVLARLVRRPRGRAEGADRRGRPDRSRVPPRLSRGRRHRPAAPVRAAWGEAVPARCGAEARRARDRGRGGRARARSRRRPGDEDGRRRARALPGGERPAGPAR